MKDIESCSFCQKKRLEVLVLVKSNTNNVFICNECVSLCEEIILDHIRDKRLGKDDAFHLNRPLVAMVPKELALSYKIVPVDYSNNCLIVAGISSEKKHEVIKMLKVGRRDLKVGFLEYPYKSTVLNTLKKYYGNK